MPGTTTFEQAQLRMKALQDAIQSAEREHAKAEGELQAAEEEKARVERQCQEAGVKPEDLDTEIAAQMAAIETALVNAVNALEGVDTAEATSKESDGEIDELLGGDGDAG